MSTPSEFDVTRVLVTAESGADMPAELVANGAVAVAEERGHVAPASTYRLTGEGRAKLARFRRLFARKGDDE